VNEKDNNQIENKVSSVLGNVEDKTLYELSNQIYHSFQTLLEFMDKGIKGLLTGDLSVYLIQQV